MHWDTFASVLWIKTCVSNICNISRTHTVLVSDSEWTQNAFKAELLIGEMMVMEYILVLMMLYCQLQWKCPHAWLAFRHNDCRRTFECFLTTIKKQVVNLICLYYKENIILVSNLLNTLQYVIIWDDISIILVKVVETSTQSMCDSNDCSGLNLKLLFVCTRLQSQNRKTCLRVSLVHVHISSSGMRQCASIICKKNPPKNPKKTNNGSTHLYHVLD